MGVEALLIATTAISAGSALIQGITASETADTQAELARRQGVADQDAALAQAEKIRRAGRAQASQANAALAASGVSLGAGTPVMIDEQIYRDSESDAMNTILTGSRQQRSANDQAAILKSQGDNAMTAGFLNAGTSVLAAGAKVGAGWKSAAVSQGPQLGAGLRAPTSGFWGGR